MEVFNYVGVAFTERLYPNLRFVYIIKLDSDYLNVFLSKFYDFTISLRQYLIFK